jgi:hypothetical protein
VRAAYGLKDAPKDFLRQVAENSVTVLPRAGFFATVLLLLRWVLILLEAHGFIRQVLEIFRFLASLCCCSCSCGCARRNPKKIDERWAELVLLAADSIYQREQQLRHDDAVRYSWSKWSSVSAQIRRNVTHWTWRDWNVFGGRLRRHLWHRTRRARAGPLPR